MQRLRVNRENRNGTTDTVVINVSTHISEMTFREWVDYFLLLEEQPKEVLDFTKGQTGADEISDETWVQYLLLLVGIVKCFSDATLGDLVHLPVGSMDAKSVGTISGIASEISKSIAEYKPKEISEFTHRGQRYVLPVAGQETYGDYTVPDYTKSVTVAQAIESFQRGHLYNMPGPDGERMKDRRFQTDLAVVASLARRVDKSGVQEQPPLGVSEYSNWVSQRMNEFGDLPATVAINACFFLINSQARYLATLTRRVISSQEIRKAKKR